MAIFASTTLGSSDPAKAMSIKALEARAQALAAAQAQQQAPTSMPSPWQGAGYLANTLADTLATRRADQQAGAGRQRLAELMSGYSPDAPDAQQRIGQITGLDQTTGMSLMQQAQQAREAAANRAQQEKLLQERAGLDEKAAQAQEERVRGRPSDLEKRAGRPLTPEEGTGLIKKEIAPPAGEQKLNEELQNKNIDLQASSQAVDEAVKLLNTGKVYSGAGGQTKSEYGNIIQKVPGVRTLAGVDPESTKISERYNQILNSQVLPILNQLKGSMSNADREWAIATLNNPSTNRETKQAALEMLQRQVKAHLEQSNKNLATAGTSAVQVGAPAAGAGATAAPTAGGDALSKARAAIAAGAPRDAVIKRLQDAGISTEGL